MILLIEKTDKIGARGHAIIDTEKTEELCSGCSLLSLPIDEVKDEVQP